MRDKLLYLTIGLLVGIAVIPWITPDQPKADPFAGLGFGVIALDHEFAIDAEGRVWELTPTGWQLAPPSYQVTIPIEQLKFWSPDRIVSHSNEAWRRGSDTEGWIYVGAWPGPSVPTESSTIGNVKGIYQGKDNE